MEKDGRLRISFLYSLDERETGLVCVCEGRKRECTDCGDSCKRLDALKLTNTAAIGKTCGT